MKIQTMTIKDKPNRKYSMYGDFLGEVRKVLDIDNSFTTNDGKEHESHYLEVALDDENEERFYLIDRDMSHKDLYEKGKEYKFKVRIDVEEGFRSKTKINVVSFTEI